MVKTGSSSPGDQEVLSSEQQALVRRQLDKILSSPALMWSRRTQDSLLLVLEHTLDGELGSLKERMIGAEMFGRPVSYDTGSDSVVRVRASEARKKLALYYGEARGEPVRIELPSGSYVPRFSFQAPSTPTSAPTISEGTPAAHRPLNSAQPRPASEVPSAAPGFLRSRLFWASAGGVALLLVLADFYLLPVWRGDSLVGRGIHSIAILPLENLSGPPSQDYFADGLTEELINDLGQVSTLRVISLTSSMSYKGSKKKLPDIAHELNVDAIVEGGVLREGDQVRISAQLIDARRDRQIWAHTYDRSLTNVLGWQGEMAQAIAEAITTNLK